MGAGMAQGMPAGAPWAIPGMVSKPLDGFSWHGQWGGVSAGAAALGVPPPQQQYEQQQQQQQQYMQQQQQQYEQQYMLHAHSQLASLGVHIPPQHMIQLPGQTSGYLRSGMPPVQPPNTQMHATVTSVAPPIAAPIPPSGMMDQSAAAVDAAAAGSPMLSGLPPNMMAGSPMLSGIPPNMMAADAAAAGTQPGSPMAAMLSAIPPSMMEPSLTASSAASPMLNGAGVHMPLDPMMPVPNSLMPPMVAAPEPRPEPPAPPAALAAPKLEPAATPEVVGAYGVVCL